MPQRYKKPPASAARNKARVARTESSDDKMTVEHGIDAKRWEVLRHKEELDSLLMLCESLPVGAANRRTLSRMWTGCIERTRESYKQESVRS